MTLLSASASVGNRVTGHVVVVGSLNADLTVETERLPGPGETLVGSDLQIRPGGKSSNQSVAAAKLGSQVTLVGRVGDDPYADLLLQSARQAGVNVDAVLKEKGTATGTAIIAVDACAENFIIVSPGANARVGPEVVQQHAPVLDGADVLCLCLEIEQGAVLAAAHEARVRGVTVVLNLSPYADVPDALLAATDILLVNEHELVQVAGTSDLNQAPEALRKIGITRAVVTLGADGALVIDGDDTTAVPTPKVHAVDTTGCGDALTGALAHHIAAGDTLLTATRYATQVAAHAATRHGAQSSYPDRSEMADILQPPQRV